MKIEKMDILNIILLAFIWYMNNLYIIILVLLAFSWGSASNIRRQKNA